MHKDDGAPALPTGLSSLRDEASKLSSPKASIPSAGRRQVTLADFRAELAAQGVGHRDYAFKCVNCGTVQSMNSLVAAGVSKDAVDRYVGFSCEGRWSQERGCDWTLGGLFTIHTLEVLTEDGERHPRFEPATEEEAKALAQAIEARRAETGTGSVHESAVATPCAQ